MQQFDGVMFFTSPQHVERLSEGKFSHDIETVVIEPQTGIQRFAPKRLDLIDEIICVAFHSGIVAIKSWCLVSE